MPIKFLHLNMLHKAVFLKEIIAYIKANDFDIINLQEVAYGSINEYKDVYQILKDELPNYKSEFANALSIIGEKKSYFGNATFFKSSFSLLDTHIVWMKPFAEMIGFDMKYAKDNPRNALHLILKHENKTLHVLNTHLAWGPKPNDEPYKLHQAEILYDYFKKKIKSPFIFSGDFNLTSDSQIVSWFNTFGKNLTVENKIINTLNPHIHKAKELFPKGLAVDYIYVSKNVQVEDFHVVKEDLSDHLGLYLDCKI